MKNIFLSLVIVFCISSVTEANSEIWCVGDSQKVKPYDKAEEKNFFWDGREKIVRLNTAKNEYVAFQIVVKALGEELSGVNIMVDDFRGKNEVISKENVDLFKEHYLKVENPSSSDAKPVPGAQVGEYPTQMIPFYAPKGGAPFDVECDRNQPIWVDLYIPENAAAGEYESYFTVITGDKELIKIKVLLTVWDFTLPHQTHFRTYIYYGSEQIRWAYGYNSSHYPAFRWLEGKFFEMARQHRLNLCPNLEMKWGYDKFDEYWNKRGRGIYIDGSAYTERVGKGIPANTWVILIDDFDHKPEYQRLSKATLKYFAEKGLSDILMLYVYDEPSSEKHFNFIKERCEWVHEAVGRELPCMVTTPIKSGGLFKGPLEEHVDIWNSGGSSLRDMERRKRKGDKIWTYNSGWGLGPFVDTPGISGRTQGWVGWKFGFEGWHFWDSCYWIDTGNLRDEDGRKVSFGEVNSNPDKYATDVWENAMTFDQMKRPGYLEKDALRLNGDGVLFYPGVKVSLKEPISSFIMKSLRRGLQDYEYLYLAKELGKERETESVVNSVIPAPKKWNEDVNAWYEARIKIAEIILSALGKGGE